MADINFILQGKGGIGKSFISTLLAQYYQERGDALLCVDTDPVNSSFASFKAFDATALQIVEDNVVDPRRFDQLAEMLFALPNDSKAQAVIDNGASTFVPICAYVLENKLFSLLQAAGHNVHIHVPIAGGPSLDDTLSGLNSLMLHFTTVPLIVWLNPFLGSITAEGKTFYEFGIYTRNLDRFAAIIPMPKHSRNTFGKDIEEMMKARMTFAEALSGDAFGVMVRQRLKIYWQDIKEVMAAAEL